MKLNLNKNSKDNKTVYFTLIEVMHFILISEAIEK